MRGERARGAKAGAGWAIAAGLGLALGTVWLRTRHLGFTEMWEDQALTLNMALEWVHGGALPLASMKSSFGVFNPPLIEYLYALPLFIRPDILGVTWLIALANLAGVLAAGAATQRVYGWRVAWWSTLLFAVNPWAAYYGRLIWMQSFVPAFAGLFYACLLLYLAEAPRTRYALGGALSLAATLQVHLTAVVLLAAVGLLAVVFARHVRWRPLLAAGVLFAVTWTPFALFEWRNGFVDWAALRQGLGQPAKANLAPVLILLDLLQGRGLLAGLEAQASAWWLSDIWRWPYYELAAALLALAVAAAAGSILGAWRANGWRHLPGRVRGQVALLAWLLVPMIVFIRQNQYLQNYYFLYLFPVPFVLLALLAEKAAAWWTGRAARQPARAPVLASLAFVPLALLAFQQLRQDVVMQNLGAAGVMGRERVVDVRRAIATTRRLLGERPDCQLVVISNGAEYEASRFALLREFARPNAVRFLAAGGGFLLPSPCALYFVTDEAAETQAWLDATAAPLSGETIQTPEERWTFYDLPPAARQAAAAGPGTTTPLGAWADGLELRQVAVEGQREPGTALTVRSTWLVTATTPRPTIHFGTYLLADGPRLVAQVDGPGPDSAGWTAGDLFGTVFTLALPPDLAPGRYELATALYSYPAIQRLRLAGDGGDLLVIEALEIAAR